MGPFRPLLPSSIPSLHCLRESSWFGRRILLVYPTFSEIQAGVWSERAGLASVESCKGAIRDGDVLTRTLSKQGGSGRVSRIGDMTQTKLFLRTLPCPDGQPCLPILQPYMYTLDESTHNNDASIIQYDLDGVFYQ